MKTPLHNAVEAYIAAGRARFHMPGHKGTEGLEWDITEVEGCDSLYEASGPILELEQEAARIYGAGAALLSAGGATLCIQTMLALCGAGQKIIAGRGIHKSALNAMILLDQQPIWVYPESWGWFLGPYTPEKIEAALQQEPEAAGVYITSPDYFGVMSDIEAIAQVCRRYGKPLLVDNAHGAHLKFLPGKTHPMDCGAAMCADSLHKTLPAMTGAAVLYLADGSRQAEARRFMSLFGSTSPSYPILLSCEKALAWAEEKGRQGFAETAERFRQLSQTAKAFPQPAKMDPAKLTVAYGPYCSSEAFGKWLRGHGVEPEYIGGGTCVFMGNPFNPESDYTKLEKAIQEYPLGLQNIEPVPLPPPLQTVVPLRQAAFSPEKEIPLMESPGHIAARESSPCPPGIPVVMCGERIDEAMAEYMARRGMKTVWVMA